VSPAPGFCAPCTSRIRWALPPVCASCGLPFAAPGDVNHRCEACLRHPRQFRQARACALYETGVDDHPLKMALHRYKYRSEACLARPLARILLGRCPLPAHDYDRIVPVPLHTERLRWRGFNQALLLARPLSTRTGIPIDPHSLRRLRATRPQVELTGTERRANVARAFVVARPLAIRGRRILLVDDVYTTGSTVEDCSRALRAAGARVVDVLVLARAVTA
jgi:ComF family protein